MTNQELRAELAKYCLAYYEDGMDVVIETFTETDWAYVIGKAQGSFEKGVELLKNEIGDYVDYRSEIEATEF